MSGETTKSQQDNTPNMDPPPYDGQMPPPYPTDQKPASSLPSWSPCGDQTQRTYAYSMPYQLPPHTQQPQRQQPVSVVIMNAGEPTTLTGQPIVAETYTRQICLACIVMLCCNCLFGLIAYILATTAQSLSLTDRTKAHRLAKLSLKISLTGIIVSIIVSFFVGGVCHVTHRCWDRSYPMSNTSCSGYEIEGVCYSRRRSVAGLSNCNRSFEACCFPSEDMYYRRYCYTLMKADQPDVFGRSQKTAGISDFDVYDSYDSDLYVTTVAAEMSNGT